MICQAWITWPFFSVARSRGAAGGIRMRLRNAKNLLVRGEALKRYTIGEIAKWGEAIKLANIGSQ